MAIRWNENIDLHHEWHLIQPLAELAGTMWPYKTDLAQSSPFDTLHMFKHLEPPENFIISEKSFDAG